MVDLMPLRPEIVRVQTGVRLEARLLKVLKALAQARDMTLGDLLEGICLHAFEGKTPFAAATLVQIAQLRSVYGLKLTAAHSHKLQERSARRPANAKKSRAH
jgi:predicted DNA-binding ribbon-helix-helix protein